MNHSPPSQDANKQRMVTLTKAIFQAQVPSGKSLLKKIIASAVFVDQ